MNIQHCMALNRFNTYLTRLYILMSSDKFFANLSKRLSLIKEVVLEVGTNLFVFVYVHLHKYGPLI